MALHLKFALNLETLADEMVGEVKKCWESPFESPMIIFSEYKLEQWFRLHWIENKENGNVLANLKRKSLDAFLMEILSVNGEKAKKLTPDILRNVIIAYLMLSENGTSNLEKFDAQIGNYLYKKMGEKIVDEKRLFDFAERLAKLFLEYETSRPGNFLTDVSGKVVPGILDCWKDGNLKPFFKDRSGKAAENEQWERELYSAIFHGGKNSLLSKVFKKAKEEFLTMPYLYKACNGKFNYNSKQPVFILGLSGMGQFYRVVLQKFAEEHEVYAYIQNPCREFWEDVKTPKEERRRAPKAVYNASAAPDAAETDLFENENELLRAWGRSGRDNIRLWSLADNYEGGFSDDAPDLDFYKDSCKKSPTLLHEVQRMIAERKNQFSDDFDFQKNKDAKAADNSLTISAAPTRMREVENLHSQICGLLKDGARIRDILVVAPNLSAYRTAILQVFEQNEKGSERGVHLPCVIVDSAERESLVGKALENLFAVKKSKSLSRTDFFELVRNPVVQEVRKIPSDEVSKWQEWVSGMNIYRSHEKNENGDWVLGVRRLLLARLSNDEVENCIPYSDMASSDDRSLCRFVEAVESLEKWRKDVEPVSEVSAVQNFLNEWLRLEDAPAGLGGEAIVFRSVMEALENLKYQKYAGVGKISWEMIEATAKGAAETSEYTCGKLFVNGVTFMKFAPNRVIPVKHLFFLGANASDFPGATPADSLDLRKSVARWPGDDTAVEKNRYAFLCQLMSTSESFHISYRNKYLPKDEELYPSSVVIDLKRALENAIPAKDGQKLVKVDEILPTRELHIDEDRPLSELYTERSRRNWETRRNFLTNLQKAKEKTAVKDEEDSEKSQNSDSSSRKHPERVSAFNLRKFLEDPFEFQADRAINLEDAEEDPEKISIEPVSLNNLEKSRLLKKLVAQKLGIDVKDLSSKEKLQKLGTIPLGSFGDQVWKDLNSSADSIVEKIKADPEYGNWEESFRSEKLDVLIPSAEKSGPWTLCETVQILAGKENELTVFKAKDEDIDSFEKFIPEYVEALGLIASEKATGVKLWPRPKKSRNDKEAKEPISVKISKIEACARLDKIYRAMYVENYRTVVPASLLKEKFENIWDLKNKLKDAWKYFAGKNLFDVRDKNVLGYSKENFEAEWSAAKEKMKNLMPEIANAMVEKSAKETGTNAKGKK